MSDYRVRPFIAAVQVSRSFLAADWMRNQVTARVTFEARYVRPSRRPA